MKKNGKKKLALITLGCQMNKHDSECLAGLLQDEYDVTSDRSEADVVMINTCTVRDKAEQKFFSLLGRLRPLKEANRNLIIGVAGCVAQDHGAAIVKREPMVDLIIGTRAIGRAHEMLRRFEETGERQVDISDTATFDDYPMRRESAVSAWVSIMQGCDNYCSYCIVPHTRGAERSRRSASIVNEIRALSERGYREVTLLGQNVNSYGRGLAPAVDFPDLLEKVSEIDGIERIRFVTSHPKDLSDRLIGAMAELPHVCPSLHLPIQSGSNNVLERMNRGYTVDHYFERVDRLREKAPGIALTTDVIVGFPGETDQDFEGTLTAIEKAQYDNIFLFKFSPRRSTPAAAFTGRVDNAVAGERFDRLANAQKQITQRRYRAWVGREIPILVEGPSKKDASKQSGRTAWNHIVHFSSDIDNTGQIIHVKISDAGQYSLEGTVVDDTSSKG